MRDRDALQVLHTETRPTADAVERVREQVMGDEELARHMLAALPDVPPDAQQRVRAAVLAAAREGVRPTQDWRPVVATGGIALAAAAVALLAVQVPMGTSSSTSEPTLLEEAPLSSNSQELQLQPTEHVALSFSGTGTLSGTDQAPRVAWERGTLRAEVTPDQGIDLQITTDEALVRVVGTVFEVNRDARGTTVTVERGKVEVDCAGDPMLSLSAGQSGECLPTTAPRLLGRARAMQEAGRTDEMLVAADRGLGLAETGSAISTELVVARISALASLDRRAEARTQAEQWLDLHPEGSRVVEVRRTAAALALQDGDCAAAWPHLDALVERSEAEEAWHRSCPPE